MIESLNFLIFTIIGLVPGFIIDSIIRIKFPLKKRDASFSIYRFIVFSCLNYFFWLWKIPDIVNFYKIIPLEIILTLGIAIIIISPIIISLIIIKTARCKVVTTVLEFLGCKIDNSIPSAWDYKFLYADKCYVIITLIDGETIYGKFGSQSFASDYEECDLYLEKLFTYDKEKSQWCEYPNTDGILISRGQIKYIEFIK